MRFPGLVFEVMLLSLTMTTLVAAEGRQVIVATDATFPPMEMVDKDKNIVGFDMDFIKAVAKEAAFTVTFKNTAWDGIFAGLAAKKYDAVMSSVTITPERRKKYDFSEPYLDAGQVLVVPKGQQVTSLVEMKGKKVGAQISTTGAMEVKKIPGIELKSYDEIGLAFADMDAGRIEGVVIDTPVAANYALHKPEYRVKFKIATPPFTEEHYGIMVKKGDTSLLEILNRGIRAVKAKGIAAELEKKWLR